MLVLPSMMYPHLRTQSGAIPSSIQQGWTRLLDGFDLTRPSLAVWKMARCRLHSTLADLNFCVPIFSIRRWDGGWAGESADILVSWSLHSWLLGRQDGDLTVSHVTRQYIIPFSAGTDFWRQNLTSLHCRAVVYCIHTPITWLCCQVFHCKLL